MPALIGLFAGAIIGNLIWHEWGAAILGIVGFIAGAKVIAARRGSEPKREPTRVEALSPGAAPTGVRVASAGVRAEGSLLSRIEALERRVASLELEGAPRAGTGPEGQAPPDAVRPADSSPGAADWQHSDVAPALPPVGDGVESASPAAGPSVDDGPRRASPGGEPPPWTVPVKANPVWAWFIGRNTLTRIGVVVLFFGVAFLLRYFAERFAMPIELRLAAVAAGGLGLIGVGLAMTASRPGYGLSLEGAGAGVLYLTTYAAFRMYGVLPEAAALALLVAVSVLTIWLALRSDSQSLAGSAIAGGFLAPTLVATDGEPLHLFGYFAVLNGAIFALAWTRAWRGLNALGFVFTFVLGVLWGRGYYSPQHYAIVQPFLALFFAFYVTIAILYARRGPLVARDPVDGLLVFGVPLAGFALQAAIVSDVANGAAASALIVALVYALLGWRLRKRAAEGFALLARAFLTLAVIFATIAIPYLVDNRTTAALWAVEAAGVYWIGVRQHSRRARALALLVEFGSGLVFFASGVGGGEDRLFANAFFAGAILIGASGIVTAGIGDRAREALSAAEREVNAALFVWGVLWWLAAGGLELERHLPRPEAIHAILAWVSVSAAAALALAHPVGWPRLGWAGAAALPAIVGAAVLDFGIARTTLTTLGWIAFPLAWIVHIWALRAADALRPRASAAAGMHSDAPAWLGTAHAVSALMLTAQISWEASEWTGRVTALRTAWTPCAAALPAIVYLALGVRLRNCGRWPLEPFRNAYTRGAGIPIAAVLGVWLFAVSVLSPGDSSPLSYLPLANPLDLTLAVALLALFAWARSFAGLAERTLQRWTGAAVFVALNGVVIRTAHHWIGIPWHVASMLASKPLQAALTLTWTATALAAMVVAARRRLRPLWMFGAALLAIVVGKLFLVDLGALSGLPRVVAFLGVGLLLLVIGLVSPLPPLPQAQGTDRSP